MVKKFFFYTLALLILSFAMWLQQATKPHYTSHDVLGSTANLQLFTQPESGNQPIIDAINSAQKEVLVEVYLLSDKTVISALEQAKARGVNVQVMLEEHPFGGGSLNPKTKTELTKAGVAVAWTNPSFDLTHEKVMVIDETEAFILNQNLTASASKSNREFNIVDTNPTDVKEVVNIFQSDWNRTSFSPTSTDLLISPISSRGKLETLINSSQKSLQIEMEVIGDPEVEALLETKAKSESVQLILADFTDVADNKKAADTLKAAGIQIHTMIHPYLHAKMILIDEQRAYIGSINLTTQSMDNNRELGIIVAQEDIIQTVEQTFQNDWHAGESY